MTNVDKAGIARVAMAFREELQQTKARLEPEQFWYPYDTLSNFLHFEKLLQGEHKDTVANLRAKTIVDIGSADGDMAFFLESRGNTVDVVDHASTNFNGLRGVTRLKEHLASAVSIYDIDLDSQFSLPRAHYDAAFFLGILYHLKNPYYMMEALARRVDVCFLSTKVAKYAGPLDTRIDGLPIAYLLGPTEANNDPTNFWVFSDPGLRRLLERTGWDVISYVTVGNVTHSDPATAAGDERAFCYLRSRYAGPRG